MFLLELFSGTGSVGNVARDLGLNVESLDRDMEADLQMAIMNWNYHDLDADTFDIIWASPPCTEYSRAKTVGVRDIEGSNKVVQRTLDIIDYFDPEFFILENPQTGLLKDQEIMREYPFDEADYCKYGMPYRKRTRLWNNINIHRWKPRASCKKDCGMMNEEGTRHQQVAQRGKGKAEDRASQRCFRQAELYKVPSELIKEILLSII